MAIFTHVIEHVVDGRTFEIKTLFTGTGWQVSIWDEGKRRIGPIYSVAVETAQDAEAMNLRPALEALVEIATTELDAGRVKPSSEDRG